MFDIESPSITQPSTRVAQARPPHQEIAQLLAAAILRMRAKGHPTIHSTDREVSLDFTGSRSVNANPSYTEGVQQ